LERKSPALDWDLCAEGGTGIGTFNTEQ